MSQNRNKQTPTNAAPMTQQEFSANHFKENAA